MDSLVLATGTQQASILQQGSNTGPHSDRIYRNGLSVCQCACALLPFFSLFSLTPNSKGSLKLKGIHFPFLKKDLNFPARQALQLIDAEPALAYVDWNRVWNIGLVQVDPATATEKAAEASVVKRVRPGP
jgi:hypothetical protein